MTTDHIIWDSECINLYTEDNKPLEIGDSCYCLIFNTIDYYRPLLCRGIVRDEKFDNGLNKEYYVQILEIIETPRNINTFVLSKQFVVYPLDNDGKIKSRKLQVLTHRTDYTNITFPIKSFFIRKELDQIKQIRVDFGNFMKDDLTQMLIETNSYLELK